MGNLGSYIVGGLALLLATDYVAPPMGTGMAFAGRATALSTVAENPPKQIVDRTRKGDRLTRAHETAPPAASKREQPPKVMVGCDPAFSPLSSYARLNYASRCLADNGAARQVLAALP